MTDYFYSFEILAFSGGTSPDLYTMTDRLLALRDEENQ